MMPGYNDGTIYFVLGERKRIVTTFFIVRSQNRGTKYKMPISWKTISDMILAMYKVLILYGIFHGLLWFSIGTSVSVFRTVIGRSYLGHTDFRLY